MSAITSEVGEVEMINGTRALLELLAGKWTVEVLYLLATGTRRYSEVLYEVGEISKKTLTHTLRTLEQAGLVARSVQPEVPVRVEYSLTPLGRSLASLVVDIENWVTANYSKMTGSVRRYDSSAPSASTVR